MDRLPNELLVKVFKCLDNNDVVTCSKLNKKFHYLIKANVTKLSKRAFCLDVYEFKKNGDPTTQLRIRDRDDSSVLLFLDYSLKYTLDEVNPLRTPSLAFTYERGKSLEASFHNETGLRLTEHLEEFLRWFLHRVELKQLTISNGYGVCPFVLMINNLMKETKCKCFCVCFCAQKGAGGEMNDDFLLRISEDQKLVGVNPELKIAMGITNTAIIEHVTVDLLNSLAPSFSKTVITGSSLMFLSMLNFVLEAWEVNGTREWKFQLQVEYNKNAMLNMDWFDFNRRLLARMDDGSHWNSLMRYWLPDGLGVLPDTLTFVHPITRERICFDVFKGETCASIYPRPVDLSEPN